MFQSRQKILRFFSRSFILFTFFPSFHIFAQGSAKAPAKWYTHWNGKRKSPTDPKQLRPSVHVAEDAADALWELSAQYEGKTPTSENGVPGFSRIPMSNKLFFSRLLESGTRVKIEKILAASYIHYYGVTLEGDAENTIYWVAGAYLKRIPGSSSPANTNLTGP